MVSSLNKQTAIIVLAIAGMVTDILLNQRYEQALLIHSLTECSGGCRAEGIITLPVFFGINFAQLQWTVFAIQFVSAVLLLKKYGQKLQHAQQALLFFHAGIVLLIISLSLHRFIGAERYLFVTLGIAVASMLIARFFTLSMLRKKNSQVMLKQDET